MGRTAKGKTGTRGTGQWENEKMEKWEQEHRENSKKEKPGDGRRETGDGRRETGDGRRETGRNLGKFKNSIDPKTG
jgi:hypothetical protein